MNAKVEVLPDYFSFTIRNKEPFEVIRDVLCMDPRLFKDVPVKSWYGYEKLLRYECINVAYQGKENKDFQNMGVFVSMSGHGCRVFETMSGLGDVTLEDGSFSQNFLALFAALLADETVNLTRLDIAGDDRSGILDKEDLIDFYRAHKIRSRATCFELWDSQKCKIPNGFCLYIGSHKSENFAKIYDKEAEMKHKKLVDTGHWIRVELTLRNKYVEPFIRGLVSGISAGELYAEVLNGKFEFINDDDSNKSRCSVAGFWAEFVDCLKKVRLVSRRVVQTTVTQMEKWIKDQIAPSVYVLFQTIGYDAFRDIILGEKERVENNPAKCAIISAYWDKKKADEAMHSFWRTHNTAKHFLEKYGFELENEDTWQRWGPIWNDDTANEVYKTLSDEVKEHIRTALLVELEMESA